MQIAADGITVHKNKSGILNSALVFLFLQDSTKVKIFLKEFLLEKFDWLIK